MGGHKDTRNYRAASLLKRKSRMNEILINKDGWQYLANITFGFTKIFIFFPLIERERSSDIYWKLYFLHTKNIIWFFHSLASKLGCKVNSWLMISLSISLSIIILACALTNLYYYGIFSFNNHIDRYKTCNYGISS